MYVLYLGRGLQILVNRAIILIYLCYHSNVSTILWVRGVSAVHLVTMATRPWEQRTIVARASALSPSRQTSTFLLVIYTNVSDGKYK